MANNFYVIVFSGGQTSQTFATVRAARARLRWYLSQAWAADAAIYRGGPGGERVS